MIKLVKTGVTHVINMQIEFDDRPLCEPYDVKVLWNATDDDFQPKPPELLDAGVQFALKALAEPETKIYVHCAAGVHRAPMMTLAILRANGWSLEDALETVQSLRPVVDWADVYVKSVERYISTKYQVPST
jgi:protein-tyrosine phosphatase